MKILITGARGQLGHDCVSALQTAHELTATDLPEFDVTERTTVTALVKQLGPDAIVNCAAYTAVDRCETDRDVCHAVNAEAPWILAEAARTTGARLVHISTDYVFDGRRPPPAPYVETDTPGPQNWYGATKLAGEQAVLEIAPQSVVLRTAWLYGRHGHNFLKTILRKAVQEPRRPLRVVDDQYGSPTWSWRLALQIQRMLAVDAEGIFHATAEGHCTWYAFAREFLRLMNVPHLVEPCRTEDFPTPAARPGNSILENARLKQAGLNVMKDWREDLAEYAARFGPDLLREAQGAS